MLEKLLLAVDQSEHSRKAVPATVELARAGGGAVHVLHVRELHYPVPPTGVTAEGAVRPSTGGSPAGPILEYAREVGAGLIVVGSHGHSILGGLLVGSVAHKLTQLSTCPVLVVRDQASLEERHHDVLRAQTRFQS
jgi:nucleotide-binding universal stress UspA family protein